MTSPTILATALIAVSILDIIAVVLFIRQRNTINEQRGILTAANIAAEKRTNIIAEQEQMLTEMNARNERLHHDLKAMRDRLLPQLTPLPDWEREFLEKKAAIDMEPDPGLSMRVDEDVSRPYIPDYEGRERPWMEER